jgi:hypothetical protein
MAVRILVSESSSHSSAEPEDLLRLRLGTHLVEIRQDGAARQGSIGAALDMFDRIAMAPTTVKFGSVLSELGPAGVRGFADVTTEWLQGLGAASCVLRGKNKRTASVVCHLPTAPLHVAIF